MQTVSGVKQNLWRKQQSGLYAPNRMNFPIAGLVFYAPLWHPELSGSPFLSKDLNAHSCTVVGATWGSQGRTFDGDDYIIIPNNAALDIGAGNLTVLLWANWNFTTAAATRDIIGIGNWAGRAYHLSTGYQDAGTGRLGVSYANGAWRYNAGSGLNNGVFHLIGVTFSAGTPNNLWADGIPLGVGSSGTINPVLNNRIGGDMRYSAFVGTIGEVLIFNRALSLPEIQNYRASTKWRYA